MIVDFSQFAGKTLILYNDAPAAFPARVPSYDYYTGAPDQSPNGAGAILPGYGPNTRTIMQVTIAGTPAPAFNLTKLRNAFSHKTDGSGVFESSQHPIIVGQAAYNSAYGTSFAAGSNCNPIPNDPNPTFQICDGFVRVNDTLQFGFNTLKKPATKTILPLQPKAIHDEMNSTTFDEFGRMQANLGVEAQPPTPGLQNVTLYPFVNPVTEIINGTNLPKAAVTYDANGNVVSDVKITPISDPNDGTQIWRITHNGVDTHPIHFHLYDVQMLNRVTWDNIVIPHGARRARLEGHRPHQPARGHHRRPAADRAPGAVGGPERHPQPEPDGPDRVDQALQQHRPCRATRPTRSPTSSSTSAGSTSGTATS